MQSLEENGLAMTARLVDSVTGASSVKLPREYSYKSLPLAIIDAVYSTGVLYKSTENTVERFCKSQKPAWIRYRCESGRELSISEFLKIIAPLDRVVLAESIFGNHQRTSTRNGILKADAVRHCAKLLLSYGIDNFSDTAKIHENKAFDCDYCRIQGQGRDTSLAYFKMLCGNENEIKLDRHIKNFMIEYEIRDTNQLRAIAAVLQIPPRNLDYAIWQRMRNSRRSGPESKSGRLKRSDHLQCRRS